MSYSMTNNNMKSFMELTETLSSTPKKKSDGYP